jgi:uncharacterized RDD family membrane protein YckC
MTSTPDKDAPDQRPGSQQTAHPGEAVPQQSATPGQEQRSEPGSGGPQYQGPPQQGPAYQQGSPQQQGPAYQQGAPGQQGPTQQYQGAPPQYQQGGPGQYPGGPGQYQGGAQPAGYPGAVAAGGMMAGAMIPISEHATRVTGRRIVQYVIDYVIAGIIPGLAYWLFDRGTGGLHGLGWLIATVISLAVYFWYWVVRPYGHDGQTFGMQLFGLKVLSKDGQQASMMQLFIRGILLIVDTLVFGLVGLITMLFSRYRQRVGDHAAKTVVVSKHRVGPSMR